MNIEIYNALLELVKQGGHLALWGIFIWLFLGIIRLTIICLATYLVVKVVCRTISDNYKISKTLQDTKVTLVGSEVASRLLAGMEERDTAFKTIFTDLNAQLHELKGFLKKNCRKKSKESK